MRLIAVGALLGLVAQAPLQCTAKPDPSLRREDTAGDALWDLAQDFHTKHQEAAARQTMRYLAEHYPSSRYAPEARRSLGEDPDGGV